MFYFTSECTKSVWWLCGARTRYGAYSAPIAGLRERGREKWRGGKEGRGKGKDLKYMKCVDDSAGLG